MDCLNSLLQAEQMWLILLGFMAIKSPAGPWAPPRSGRKCLGLASLELGEAALARIVGNSRSKFISTPACASSSGRVEKCRCYLGLCFGLCKLPRPSPHGDCFGHRRDLPLRAVPMAPLLGLAHSVRHPGMPYGEHPCENHQRLSRSLRRFDHSTA